MGGWEMPHEKRPLVTGRFVPSAQVHLQSPHNIGLDTKPVPSVGVMAVYVGIGSDNPKVKEKITVRILRTDHRAISWRMNHMEKQMEKEVVAIRTSFVMEDGSHRAKREMESYPKVEYIDHV
jgi:hypothetical protein